MPLSCLPPALFFLPTQSAVTRVLCFTIDFSSLYLLSGRSHQRAFGLHLWVGWWLWTLWGQKQFLKLKWQEEPASLLPPNCVWSPALRCPVESAPAIVALEHLGGARPS